MMYNDCARDDFASGHMTEALGGATMTKSIPLAQGKFALVDDEDFDYLNQWKWSYSDGYAVRTAYSKDPKKTKRIKMHRVINNTPDGMSTDHINGDTLYNLRSNLRTCNKSGNAINSKIRSDNLSGYRGVGWDAPRNKWRTQIAINGKHMFVGRFENKIDAAKAYNEAAIKYHGEFARINEIPR
jgi:hypothetical protein